VRLDSSVYKTRRNSIVRGLSRKHRLDGLFVEKPLDIRYLTGFSCSKGALFLVGQGAYLVVDSRYAEQAKEELQDLEVVRLERNFLHTVSRLRRRLDGARLGYDRLYTTVATMTELRAALRGKVLWKGLEDPVGWERAVKLPQEIALIKRAVSIAQKAFQETLREALSGRSTEKKVASLLKVRMLQLGAEDFPFPVIVASGRRSSMVHTMPTAKRVAGLTLVDWGSVYEGYCCDITRTVALGRVPAKLKEIHALVMEAREAALQAISPGTTAGAVDEAARQVIERAGYGNYFNHGLGHGVGMEVHEWPVIGRGRTESLVPGMVFTVEPGIYLPGTGGVRVEDMVVTTDDGYRLLTTLPQELSPDAYLAD